MARIDRQAERYQPLPLAPDDDIEETYPWLGGYESLCIARYLSTRVLHKLSLLDGLSGTTDLASRINKLIHYVGASIIRMVTYSTDEDGIGIRVCLQTSLRRQGGKIKDLEPATFDFTMEQWKQMSAGPDDQLPAWQSDIDSLLFRKLDRHVRHVEFMLGLYGYDNNETDRSSGWKTPRQVSVKDGIPLIAKTLTKRELAEHNRALLPDDQIEQCPICFGSYQDASELNSTVMLPCSSKHCICYECFHNVCEVNGLSDTLCPYCRKQVAPPGLAPRLGPNFMDIDAPFTYDARYTEFENRERSFAAIDRVPPWKREAWIVVDKDVFVESWNQVVPHGFEDDNTPARCIYTKAPETWHFFKSFLDSIRGLDGIIWEVGDLYNVLRDHVLEAFADQYLANGMGAYLRPEDLERLLAGEDEVLSGGYADYIQRTLHRVIQLPIHRACYDHREHITETNPMGMHSHGDLVFWCPKDGAIDLMPLRERWRLRQLNM
ncbi:hypothetical protein M409DRAFT_21129 [Zasmidium cellare ATCC 36951]|uniref:RING-type domain-containing protein n=1 Tax=Zasmidium cellare ATCC 36951 TaxID=1080233 RepID=A0A6A6CMB1_ZASCE|nr:uncharacterized protein M409DRAFT_21129 [Zasmidium cellare ATCC 36951]KAF2168377.1 hypothetical protein M409DRAFT_21129 [Zasmidium cellare ATCC 36951]